MARIVVVHPDPSQSRVLGHVLRELPDADVVLVASTDAALAAIDQRIPDLVLLHELTSPHDCEQLVAYLDVLPDAAHVQVIDVPPLQILSDSNGLPRPRESRTARQPARPAAMGCDPRLFASDVARYVAGVESFKHEIDERQPDPTRQARAERRRERRWSSQEVPWVSSVSLTAEERLNLRGHLINISSGGALFQTNGRPNRLFLRRRGFEVGSRPDLMLHLASGDEVRVAGWVVRCRVHPLESGLVLYEVGFRFEEPAGTLLPDLLTTSSSGARGGASHQSTASAFKATRAASDASF